MFEVEIISTGRELLLGRTVNTNASWIATRITEVGAAVTRITAVGDSIREISAAIAESASRRPGAIILTGGLGPTFDDLTVEALASAMKVPKVLNPEAYRHVVAKYSSMGLPITPQRLKMAYLPEGCEPMGNEEGTAPGVKGEFRGVLVFCLPGVPKEMMPMFTSSVLPIISSRSGAVYGERSLVVEGIPESTLASVIDAIRHSHPLVYFKSHPKGKESSPLIEMHMTAFSRDRDSLERSLNSAESEFVSAIEKIGGLTRRREA